MPTLSFPTQALPNVIDLMEHFNSALNQEIKYYEACGDQQEFIRVLKHLSQDLSYYIEIFDAWDQNLQVLEERYQIQILARLITQAKILVTKAGNLVDPFGP